MYAHSVGNEIDFEVEYSPSLNTKRFQNEESPNERVLENFVNVTKKETERVREKYKSKSDVRYGGEDDNQLLDIYFKDKEADAPIFVYIHGGYWQCLDKSTAGSFVAPLVERGWRVLNVDYNLCPPLDLRQLCNQMWNFYDWLFKYAMETNASSIIVCGHSAGAHLASLLFTERAVELLSRHKTLELSFFLISGLYDLRELWQLECSNPKNVLNLNAALAAEFSPICWELSSKVIDFYKCRNARIHVLAAENDSKTFKAQSSALAACWRKIGLNTIFVELPFYDHFNIIEEASNGNSEISKYILGNIEHLQ